MAEGNSRRAWEIISSHRAATNPQSEANADIDDYLNHNSQYSDLVDGWSALLSNNNMPSEQNIFADVENHDSYVSNSAWESCYSHIPQGEQQSFRNGVKKAENSFRHSVNQNDEDVDLVAQEVEEANKLLEAIDCQLRESPSLESEPVNPDGSTGLSLPSASNDPSSTNPDSGAASNTSSVVHEGSVNLGR